MGHESSICFSDVLIYRNSSRSPTYRDGVLSSASTIFLSIDVDVSELIMSDLSRRTRPKVGQSPQPCLVIPVLATSSYSASRMLLWPQATRIPLDQNRPELVMLIRDYCYDSPICARLLNSRLAQPETLPLWSCSEPALGLRGLCL